MTDDLSYEFDHDYEDHDSEVCPWCQAVSYINGNRTLVSYNVRKHPDPAAFVVDIAHALVVHGVPPIAVINQLTNLLDQ